MPDPDLDDMSRGWVGWDPKRSDQVNFEHNRGLWHLSPRAERERYATFSLDGKIRLVAEIEGIEVIPTKDSSRRPKKAIVGRVLSPEHPAYKHFIDRPVDGHRNPVTYIEDPDSGPRTCACGCGEPVPGKRTFVSGHDQRAVHSRIQSEWGDTLGFINWFDATYPEHASA